MNTPSAGQLLQGEAVRLIPLDDDALGFAHYLATAEDGHWPRLWGPDHLDPQTAATKVWGPAIAAFLIVADNPVGIATIYDANFRHGHASFDVVGPPGADDLLLEEAARLVVDYAFAIFSFRKLYHVRFECQPGRCKDRSFEESRLVNAVVLDGVQWDKITDAIYRDDVVPERTESTEPPRTALSGLRREFRLRTIRPDDSPALRAIEMSPGNLVRWRYGGEIAPPPVMERMRAQSVLDQQVIEVDGCPIGLVNAHMADLRAGTAWLAVVVDDSYHRSGVGILAIARFIDGLFDTWPLRKLYAEVGEHNLTDFGSLIRRGIVAEEGVLQAHWQFGRDCYDVHHLCVDREHWMTKVRPRLRRFLR